MMFTYIIEETSVHFFGEDHLSDSLHDFDQLTEAISKRNRETIISVCEQQIIKFNRYMTHNHNYGNRQGYTTFNNEKVKEIVNIQEVVHIFENIINKVS